MNFFESTLLNLGMSWLLSKVLPYVLSLLIGLLLLLLAKKLFKGRKISLWISVPLLFIPFALYFGLFPIYEGDFSNKYITHEMSAELGLGENKMIVLAIPNCPFCFESIAKLRIIRKRHPNLKLQFLVCTDDENDIEPYKTEAQNVFEVKKYPNYNELAKTVGNRFPSYIFIDENSHGRIWSNEDFGVIAIDEVEKLLSK